VKIEPAVQLTGHVAVPGDKSISHRAVLLGAIGEGETLVRGFGRSADTEATIAAVRALGVKVEEVAHDELYVLGVGLRGLRPGTVDCANAGTLMRLLAGIAAGQPGRFELTGDESLRSRPMERIAEPLRQMGAEVLTADGHAPVVIDGTGSLHGLTYELPVASAQVKSAVLLAGINASGQTTVVEPAPTRDHTELMLESAGVPVRRGPTSITVQSADSLRLGEVDVPGDFSSAAPLLAAAALVPGSDLTIHDVGLNPRRTGLLDVLERMGAHLAVFNRHRAGREQVGDVQIQYSELGAVEVGAAEVPRLVDELPLVALLASHARGDGWTISGVPARLRGGRVDARGDHRIAMLGAVAGLASRDGAEVEGAETVAISFPGFFELLNSVVRR
jgi:3-phosphoshikimate 1-carboxyvinyltransferase